MPQKKTKKKRAKVVMPKLNNVSCPSDMTLEEWQVALRQQQAEKENFAIIQVSQAQLERLYGRYAYRLYG